MSKLGRWSTAAGSNNAAVPDGWPEGQLPSTVNNCAREMMASIRTAFEDLQYVDQDFTPTFITASSFSVPGNQTSAVHIGRRLKCFDATAGVQQVIYGTVVSVSFTAVTTIHIEADAGSLTSSLSSFGISIIANTPNNALPRNLVLTVSSIAVLGGMSISGSLAMNTLAVSSSASIGGAVFIGGGLSVSATATATQFNGLNTPKAWVSFDPSSVSSAASMIIRASYNVSSVSRSGTGVFRVNFTTALANADYMPIIHVLHGTTAGGGIPFFSKANAYAAASFKFSTYTNANVLGIPSGGDSFVNLEIFND